MLLKKIWTSNITELLLWQCYSCSTRGNTYTYLYNEPCMMVSAISCWSVCHTEESAISVDGSKLSTGGVDTEFSVWASHKVGSEGDRMSAGENKQVLGRLRRLPETYTWLQKLLSENADVSISLKTPMGLKEHVLVSEVSLLPDVRMYTMCLLNQFVCQSVSQIFWGCSLKKKACGVNALIWASLCTGSVAFSVSLTLPCWWV